jgi:hypothetical protein
MDLRGRGNDRRRGHRHPVNPLGLIAAAVATSTTMALIVAFSDVPEAVAWTVYLADCVVLVAAGVLVAFGLPDDCIITRYDGLLSVRGRSAVSAVLAVAVAVALVALLGACSSSGDDHPAPSASSQSVATTAAPTGVAWTEFNGMRIPAADQGPHTDDDIAPHGFDRTPPGAALAAINATIRLSVATDNQWPQVTRLLIAPGAARDAFIRNRIQLSTTDSVPAGQAPTIQGWVVRSFTPTTAKVDVISQMPDGSLADNHTTVVWTAAGDWGLLLPDAASTARPVEPIDAIPTTGFVSVKES